MSSADVALGFTGQRHDDDLGLIDYHGRAYDPVQKRFLTPDPLVPNPLHSQSFNRYAYVGNNPLRFIDPSGFDGEPAAAQNMPHMAPLMTLPDVLIIGNLRRDNTAPSPVQSSDGHGSQPASGGTAAPSPPSPPSASAAPDSGPAVAGPVGDLPTDDDEEEVTSWRDTPIVQGIGRLISGVALGLVPFAGAGETVAHGAGLTAPGTREANIGKSIGEIIGGAITTYLGIGGGAGGVAASLTGVGAAVGIPEIAVSVGLVVGGVTNVAAGLGNLQTALSTGGSTKGAAGGPRAGMSFTPKDRRQVIGENREKNSGEPRCENCGAETTPGQKGQRGVSPSPKETNVDHIIPKARNGDGSPENGQVLCRGCNRSKSDNMP